MEQHDELRKRLIQFWKDYIPPITLPLSKELWAFFVAMAQSEKVQTRNACFQDITRLIEQCVTDTPSECGKFALQALGAALLDSGPQGFGDPDCPCDEVTCVYSGSRMAQRVAEGGLAVARDLSSEFRVKFSERREDYENQL